MDDTEQEQRIKVRKSLMGLLSRREHSRLELAQKIQKKGFDIELINSNIDDFIERDWQSDLRYAAMLIRSRVLKCHGPVKVKMELKQKGVSSVIIESSFDEDFDWSELASTALNKKFTHQAADEKEKNKQYRFLLQRGFTNDQIKIALKSLLKV